MKNIKPFLPRYKGSWTKQVGLTLSGASVYDSGNWSLSVLTGPQFGSQWISTSFEVDTLVTGALPGLIIVMCTLNTGGRGFVFNGNHHNNGEYCDKYVHNYRIGGNNNRNDN